MLLNIFWDFGILDPEKTYSGSRIPDPGVKKAPDPGSATLDRTWIIRMTDASSWQLWGWVPLITRRAKATFQKIQTDKCARKT